MISADDKYNIILVDDSKIDLFIVEKMLLSVWNDVQITKYENAEDALAFVSTCENKHYTIFLDIQMPVMNGFEWLDKFDKLNDDLKQNFTIFILTSSNNPSDINRGKSSPHVKDVLLKPLQKETLITLPIHKI